MKMWFCFLSVLCAASAYFTPMMATQEGMREQFPATYQLVYQGEAVLPFTLYWSPDSRYLYFEDVKCCDETTLYSYDVESGYLTSIQTMPFIRRLNFDEQAHFQMRDDYAYVAPDDARIVYIADFTISSYFYGRGSDFVQYLYAVGNLEDGHFLPTRITVQPSFQIRWSDDSSAFVIETRAPYGGVRPIFYVVYDYSLIRQFTETYVAQLGTFESIFDISPDGRRILFPNYHGLMLWDPMSHGEPLDSGVPDAQIIDAGNVIGAAFVPEDENLLLFVNEQGVIEYNLATHEYTVLDSNINSNWASWAMFSPNNETIALLIGNRGGREQVFIAAIHER